MKHFATKIALLAGGCLLSLAVAAQSMQATAPTARDGMDNSASAPRDPALKPYFDAFGGKAGLTAMVDDFMANLMADPRTEPFFAKVDRDHIKKELVDQFCVILDGPCSYTGASMAEAHRGLGISRADFNALVEDLQKAMTQHHVPFRAQNKLLAKLAPMHKTIIEKH